MKKKYLVVMIAISASTAFGGKGDGGDTSGGGNVIACFDTRETADLVRKRDGEITNDQIDKIESIQALDLHDARLARGFNQAQPNIVEVATGESFDKYVNKILARVEITIPDLAQRLKWAREQFANKNVILHENSIRRVKDEATISLLESGKCALATAIAQTKKNNTWFMDVDKRLFFHPKHAETSRGVLILHEVVYSWGRDLGHADSENTRRLVAALINNDKDTRLFDVIKLAVSLNFLPGSMVSGICRDLGHNDPIKYTHSVSTLCRITESLFKEIKMFLGYEARRIIENKTGLNETGLYHKASSIIQKLKLKNSCASITSCLARLDSSSDRFYKLGKKGNLEAWTLLYNIKKYHSTQAEIIKDHLLSFFIKRWKPELQKASYLPIYLPAAMDDVAIRFIEKLYGITNAYLTPEQKTAKNAPPLPGVLIPAGSTGVYDLDDFFGKGNILTAEGQKHDAFMQEWLKNNLWYTMAMNPNYRFMWNDFQDLTPFPQITK
ncbi:MAG: hypothetical protein A2583_05570 [Bdellovibrionales bacterium RIFOXYD1_FULL_53_11]|nr:MAG: hypothetical protein A2583_05570 [Bdellovibrionales bacterium RIFOXYD1_FULL_53_11]